MSTLNKTLSCFFLLITFILIGFFYRIQSQGSTLTFLDVAQGDATFIQYQGVNILIDGGDRFSRYSDKSYLRKILSKKRVKKIDVIILSHPHADHLFGIVDFLDKGFAGLIIKPPTTHTTKLYEKFLNLVNAKNIKMLEVTSGFALSIKNDFQIEVFSPPNSFTINGLDNNSLVVMLKTGGRKFLFPGDIYFETEKWLVEKYGAKLRADYLKVSHHGSKKSSSQLFLKQVSPLVSVISCGRKNKYGFPHQGALRRIQRWSKKVHRTDESGDLEVVL